MNHNITDWSVFKDVFEKFIANFSDAKVWCFTFVFTPIAAFIETYVFADWEFLKWLSLFMFLDMVTGIMKAVKRKEAVTSYGIRRTVVKALQYGIFLIVVHGLDNFRVKGEEIQVFGWLVTAAYSFLMGIEGKSILENLATLDESFDVGRFIDKIKDTISKN